MNTQKQIFLIVALMFVFVGGCAAYSVIDLPVRASDQTVWHKDQSIERGALLFANNCRTCHGIQGQGGVGLPLNSFASTDAKDFHNQDPLVLANNRALLQRTLTCGRAGTRMPAWLNTNGGSLNQEQLVHIIDFLTEPQNAVAPDPAVSSGSIGADQPTSKGWNLALEFAHNLNRETTAVVGGETLGTIAKDHQIGVAEVAKAAGTLPTQIIPQGTTITLPDGRSYLVRNNNETAAKIADQQQVGAEIIANLNKDALLTGSNKLTFRVDENLGKATFVLLDSDAKSVFGLFAGSTLALPDNTVYVLKAADTLQSIADHHGVQVSALTTADNLKVLFTADGKPATASTDPTVALDNERKLILPQNAVVIAQAGATFATIASTHGGIKADDVASANGGKASDPIQVGQTVKLPAGAKYTIQTGDTLDSVATAHALKAADLAQLNGLQPADAISSDIVIKLPKVTAYVLTGQNLDDVAKGYSNVTADTLAAANGKIPVNSILRVGQTLSLPGDAWGSAPPDAVNPGTACVQNAVPKSVFDTLPGVGTPAAAATAPATIAKDVTIEAGAQDWHVIADGTTSDQNVGAVAVAKGTAIKFANKSGLHTIDIGGKKDGADFKQGDTRSITFSTAGTFKITCEYHPQMLATVFVQ